MKTKTLAIAIAATLLLGACKGEDPQAAATLWMSGVDFVQGNLVQQAADALDFDFNQAIL